MDVFDLVATIRLNIDEFEHGLDSARKKANNFADNLKGFSDNIGSAYSGAKDLLTPIADGFQAVESVGKTAGSAVITALKGIGAASTAAAGGAIAVGKSAFDAYANYEQLVGGVETLFKDSAGKVMSYADNAYKTAGMSANQYMETVTGFSASLLQSLGGDTEMAARYANVAITDMSDNANKMGTDMERITDAYQGFAKQNYTMLDNLKLGYGGTKSEMERLLRDAERLEGYMEGAYSIENFADIVEAINIIQDHMGIMGTTALEASTTIQGSVASMKGAWENFMVGIADSNQDLSVLMDNLIESVVTAGNNVVPRILEIVQTATRAIPEFVRGFGEIIPQFAPMGVEIVRTLADGISSQIPTLLDFGSKAVGYIADGISKNGYEVTNGIIGLLQGIAGIIGNNSDKLVSAGEAILAGIYRVFHSSGNLIKKYIGDFVPLIVEAFLSYHETFFKIGMEVLGAIGKGIVDNKEKISYIAFETIFQIVLAIRENAPAIIEGGIALINALAGAIVENLPLIMETGAEIIAQLIFGINTSLPALAVAVGAIIPYIAKIIGIISDVGGAVNDIVELVRDGIGNVMNIGGKLMEGIKLLFGLIAAHPVIAVIVAIIAAVTLLWTHCEAFRDAVKAVCEAIVNFFKSAWESIVKLWEGAGKFFSNIAEAIQNAFKGIVGFFGKVFSDAWNAVKKAWDGVTGFFSDIIKKITGVFSNIGEKFAQIGSNIVNGLKNGISNAWKSVTGFLSEKVGGLIDSAKNKLGIKSPSKVFAGIGENMALGLAEGWGGEYDSIKRQIERGLSFGTANIGVDASGISYGYNGTTRPGNSRDTFQPITIIFQPTLDGKVIGEASYKYMLDRERAYGGRW